LLIYKLWRKEGRRGKSLEERRKGSGREDGEGGREGGRKEGGREGGMGVKYHHNENTNENMQAMQAMWYAMVKW